MINIRQLDGNGDFRSAECQALLSECDVVVTNPPFSLFREYVKQLMDYGKKFIIIGSQNAINYKEIFPLIMNNQLWLGINHINNFRKPNGEIQTFGNICWYSNVENKRRNEKIDLFKKYNEKDFPKYDNYNAINVDKVCEIPMDYNGYMGVPITFLEKYNPNQFEIVGIAQGAEDVAGKAYLGIIPTIKYDGGKARPYVNGKSVYTRILVRWKT